MLLSAALCRIGAEDGTFRVIRRARAPTTPSVAIAVRARYPIAVKTSSSTSSPVKDETVSAAEPLAYMLRRHVGLQEHSLTTSERRWRLGAPHRVTASAHPI